MTTQLNIISEVKTLLGDLCLWGDDAQWAILVTQALRAYRDKAGVLVTSLVEVSGVVTLPDDIFAVSTVKDRYQQLVFNAPPVITLGKTTLTITGDVLLPVTIRYFQDLLLIENDAALPAQCVDLVIKHVYTQAKKENDKLLKIHDAAVQGDTADYGSPTDKTTELTDIEALMSQQAIFDCGAF
jgi:hypothetical protein